MGPVEQMLLKAGVIKFGDYRMNEAAVASHRAVVYDASGREKFRVEPAALGGGAEAVVLDVQNGNRVVTRIKFSVQAA